MIYQVAMSGRPELPEASLDGDCLLFPQPLLKTLQSQRSESRRDHEDGGSSKAECVPAFWKASRGACWFGSHSKDANLRTSQQQNVQVRSTLYYGSTKTLGSSMLVGLGDRKVPSLEGLNVVNPIPFV